MFCTWGNIRRKGNDDTINEYEWLKNHSLFSKIDRNAALDDSLTIFISYVRSLVVKRLNKRYCMNYRCLKNDAVGFTKTQIKPSNSPFIMDGKLKFLIWIFIKMVISLVYGSQDDIVIIWKFYIIGISIIRLRKDNLTDHVFTLVLFYWKKAMSLDEFSRMLEYLLVAIFLDVIGGGFNYDLSKVPSNKLINHMIAHTQLLNEPIHISISQIDHFCKRECFEEEFRAKTLVQNIYFFWS